MLEKLASLSIRDLAEKARVARDARDRLIASVRDEDYEEPLPMRGERNPTAALGLYVLPESDASRRALEDALVAFPAPVLRELWALILIGRGDYGLKDWDRASAEAERLVDIDERLFLEQADLHEFLMKALFELEQSYSVPS